MLVKHLWQKQQQNNWFVENILSWILLIIYKYVFFSKLYLFMNICLVIYVNILVLLIVFNHEILFQLMLIDNG